MPDAKDGDPALDKLLERASFGAPLTKRRRLAPWWDSPRIRAEDEALARIRESGQVSHEHLNE